MSEPEREETARRPLPWRAFEIICIAAGVGLGAAFLWYAAAIVILLFGAVLLACALRVPTMALAQQGIGERIALGGVLAVLLVLGVAFFALVVPQLNAQGPELVESLGRALGQLEHRLGLDQWTERMAEQVDSGGILPSTSSLLGAAGLVSSTFGALFNLFVVSVVGIYLAADPDLYVQGALRLVPASKRAPAAETLDALGRTLRGWLIGQLISMTTIGLLTYVGLLLLGVPLALVLGVIAFLLSFIPVLGPILTAVPILLIGFSQGFETGVGALGLYALIQALESYVLTPLVQRQTVALPPALTISSQLLLGALLGILGLTLATPLAAAGMVMVQRLYVEGVLGEAVEPAA